MELIKTSESYNLTDTTDSWNVSGSVTKESNGIIRLSFSANMKESDEYIGNFNYTVNAEGNVSVNFDCGRTYDDALFAYGNALIDTVVAELN